MVHGEKLHEVTLTPTQNRRPFPRHSISQGGGTFTFQSLLPRQEFRFPYYTQLGLGSPSAAVSRHQESSQASEPCEQARENYSHHHCTNLYLCTVQGFGGVL